MPNPNVGFIVALVGCLAGASAYGATTVTCDDCYKCVQYVGKNCVQCEYDEDYCMFEVCEEPKVNVGGECVCPYACEGEQDPETCECIGCGLVACLPGDAVNEETCECEKIKCKSGWYHDGSGCAACPGNTDSGTGIYNPDDITLSGGCGYFSYNYGANGITDCFQASVKSIDIGTGVIYCDYSDNTGKYQLSDDCKYSN